MSKPIKGRIAFIRPGKMPIANTILPGLLRQRFPNHEFDIFDIYEYVKKKRSVMLLNWLAALIEYKPWYVFRSRSRAKTAFYGTAYLYKHIKNMVSDMISPNQYDFTIQMQSLFDASVDGIPNFVYTDHVYLANFTYPLFNRNSIKSPRWINLETAIYRHAEKTFTWSTNISNVLINDYKIGPEKVAWVGVGVNAEISDIQMDNNGYSNKNILFVGFDWVRKGGPELVEAFKKVLKQHPDARLTIVGASPPISVSNIDIVGKIPVEEVNHYFERASVFCMPTKREPFGVVYVEAMMHRLPIVATDVGALPDIVEEGKSGYLVEHNDVDLLAQRLSYLLGNPQHCKMLGERGYQIAQQKYTWDAVADRIQYEINNILEGQAAP